MPDLYSILGLSRRANSGEIKAAYWTLVKRSHPDVNVGDAEAEPYTKEINRAYEILGDSEARAAYDLEWMRKRAKARRAFWSAVATGAATFILTLGSVSVTVAVMWIQKAVIHQSPGGQPKQVADTVRRERPVAKAPAKDQANLRSTDTGDVPSEPVSTPLPGPIGEPPASVNWEVASAPLRDRDGQTRGEPTAQSSPTLQRSHQDVAIAPSSELVVQLEDGQPLAPARDAPPRKELANAALPEDRVIEQRPAAAVDQRSSGESTRRDADLKTAATVRIHKKSDEQIKITRPAGTVPGKLQGLQREPRLIVSRATALRWPSADEPFVNVGARNR